MLDLADRPTALDGWQAAQVGHQVRGFGHRQSAQLEASRRRSHRQVAVARLIVVAPLLDEATSDGHQEPFKGSDPGWWVASVQPCHPPWNDLLARCEDGI